MTDILVKPKENFTTIQNQFLNSNEVSLKGKAMYIYLISKPQRWQFSIKRIASQMQEGETAIRNTLNELETLRLLLRRKFKKDGKFNGVIYYVANLSDSSICGFSTRGFPTHISNTNKSICKNQKPPPLEERKAGFRERCLEAYQQKKDKISGDVAKEFFEYWTECNENGNKMRFEMEKVFNINRRMNTWINNNKKKSFKKPENNYENT